MTTCGRHRAIPNALGFVGGGFVAFGPSYNGLLEALKPYNPRIPWKDQRVTPNNGRRPSFRYPCFSSREIRVFGLRVNKGGARDRELTDI
jgi:hypothetical protein